MPPFLPNREKSEYRVSFARIGEVVFTPSSASSMQSPLEVLAWDRTDGIFYETKRKNPAEVDGGSIWVNNETNTITISGDSVELKAPKSYQARNITVDTFRRQWGQEYKIARNKNHQIFPR
jgi:hypothetical protein